MHTMCQPQRELRDKLNAPVRHVIYEHHKGGLYTVVGLGLNEATLEPVVVYRNVYTSELWVRTVDNWNCPVIKPDGTLVPRFRPHVGFSKTEIKELAHQVIDRVGEHRFGLREAYNDVCSVRPMTPDDRYEVWEEIFHIMREEPSC